MRIESPKPLNSVLKILKRRSRQHSRKKKGSANRKKSALRLACIHRRIKNRRRDFLHKVSTRLAKTKRVIVVEDLNVRGMMRNRHLSRHIADAGWNELIRMLDYKVVWVSSVKSAQVLSIIQKVLSMWSGKIELNAWGTGIYLRVMRGNY